MPVPPRCCGSVSMVAERSVHGKIRPSLEYEEGGPTQVPVVGLCYPMLLSLAQHTPLDLLRVPPEKELEWIQAGPLETRELQSR